MAPFWLLAWYTLMPQPPLCCNTCMQTYLAWKFKEESKRDKEPKDPEDKEGDDMGDQKPKDPEDMGDQKPKTGPIFDRDPCFE